jgi:enterochelin esterase-like enzyme
MKSLIFVGWLWVGLVASGQSFVSDLAKVQSAKDPSVAMAKLVSKKGVPMVYPKEAVFVYKGQATKVQVAGDFNSWNPAGTDFKRLEGTDYWYLRREFPVAARLDYKLVVDDTHWMLDPLNPKQCLGGFGPNSELAMSGYLPCKVCEPKKGVVPGSLETHQVKSLVLGRTYEVKVYLPNGYDPAKRYPVAYFQDGNEYIKQGAATIILDNLIHQKKIQPVIGVFVVPANRNEEYAKTERERYREFFTEELTFFIDGRFSTLDSPDARLVLGDSYGGNISARIAFSQPDVFGLCGIHSGAFQEDYFNTNSVVMDAGKVPVKVASIWGSYEGGRLPENMRLIRDYLKTRGFELMWMELPEGHSWGLWRATLDDMLMYFFPYQK